MVFMENLEMHCTSGEVLINKLHHKVAYCDQTPCACIYYPDEIFCNLCYRVGARHDPG